MASAESWNQVVSFGQRDPAEMYVELESRLSLRRPSWQMRAACRGIGTKSHFPEPYASTAAAEAVCARCPVTEPCLAYALETNAHGIWAGTSERQRARMKRAERKAA